MTMEMTVLPMAIAMWTASPDLTSWALSTAFVLWWETGISFCFGIHSPFATLTGADYSQGVTIFGILIMLCLCFAMIGSFTCWVLDVSDILPFYAILPVSASSVWPGSKVRRDTDGQPVSVGRSVTGLNRWGMVDLPRPYFHIFLTIVLFAITVVATHLIYAFLMNDVGSDNQIALGLSIGLPIVGYIALFLFFYFSPDPFVFGPHRRNITSLKGKYKQAGNKAMVARDTKAANYRIYKTVLTLAFIHVASIIVVSFVRFTHTECYWSWITAAVVGGVILIVVLITAFVLYAFRGRENDNIYVQTMDTTPADAEGDAAVDEEGDEDEAAVVDEDGNPLTTDKRHPSQLLQKISNRFHNHV